MITTTKPTDSNKKLNTEVWTELYNVDRKVVKENDRPIKPNTPVYTYPTIHNPINIWD